MRRAGTGALIAMMLLPAGAGAVWGPFGGIGRLESETATAGDFDGFEAGVVAFGPNGEGFWQAAFTRLDQAEGPGRITRAGARLNFTVLGGAVALFYAGAAGGRNWIADPAGDRKLWTYGAQSGLLFSPADIWQALPGRRRPGQLESRRIGSTKGTLLLGAEAGWTQGPVPLQGFEFRGFVTLLY